MIKMTIGEQAEAQQNRMIQRGLSKVEKPPTGIGLPYCLECDCDIPMARRIAYGSGLCIDCAEELS